MRGSRSRPSFTAAVNRRTTRRRRLVPLVAAAVAGLTAAIVGGSPPVHAAAGQPFTSLQAPYTQALFGTSSAFLGGIAFAPNGDVWANECQFSGSPLHRYVRATSTLVHNTAVHPSSLVASNAGCGMVNHPDGKIYSNTSAGLARLDPASGTPIDVVGARGNALGVAVDPQSRAVVYVAEDCRSGARCTIARYDPAAGTSSTFAVVPGSTSTFIDGLAFDPSGQFLLMSTRAPGFRLTILNRSGQVVQSIPMGSEPDGISFHSVAPKFVLTNNTNGTITRFDFPGDDLTQTPTQSVFASGGFRGDLSQVGPDGCIYLSQQGTHYLDGLSTGDNSVVQVCAGFAPPPGVGGGLVAVAVGDSYSSGEGAPPFEDGGNYAPAVVQENTYTYDIAGRTHDSCHRSLTNYTKVAAPTYQPGVNVTLVDRTCSGATIVGSASPQKGPIVPAPGSNPPSQVDQAIQRLSRDYGGKTAADVNIVSATMGGNDAGFGDLIAACLIPNMAKTLFDNYDNAPGEVEWIISHFGDCKTFDTRLFHTEDKIRDLQAVEEPAQLKLAQAFANADLFQLTYPGIVPVPELFPGDSCGGMLRGDANYVRGKVQRIDDALRAAGSTTAGRTNGRYHIVDIQNRFGDNAICPADPSLALANGVDQAALVRTIQDLLQPGTDSRALVDDLANRYKGFRNCIVSHSFFLPAELLCKGPLDNLKRAVSNLGDYFTPDRLNALVGGLAAGDTPEQRFDNSRLFFHPNVAGFGVMACNLSVAYQLATNHGGADRTCTPTLGGALTYLFNRLQLAGSAPVPLTPGAPVPFTFNGFDPSSSVNVTGHSAPINLGSFVVDGTGTVSGSFTLPAAIEPGVHKVEFAGTNGRSPRTISVLVEVAGRPRGGGDFGLWICCFPGDEAVRIQLGGLDLGNVAPDQDGGVFISVPVPALDGAPFSVVATGTTTGTVITRTLDLQSPFTTPGRKSKAKIEGVLAYAAGSYNGDPSAGTARLAAEVQIQDDGRINGSIHVAVPADGGRRKIELETTSLVRFQRSGQRFVLEGRAKSGNVTGYNVTVVADPGQPGSALLIIDMPTGESMFVNADSQGLLGGLTVMQSGRVTADYRA